LTTDVLALAVEAQRKVGFARPFLHQEVRMRRQAETSLFQPKLSQMEKRVDATTRMAQAITDEEASAREAKTARLRAARLAREAAEGPPVQKVARKKKAPRKS
jgi:hypothetical protein